MKKAGAFARGTNPGTGVCAECGARRQRANMEGDVCIACYDRAGAENAVADGGMTPAEFHAEFGRHAWSCPESCDIEETNR